MPDPFFTINPTPAALVPAYRAFGPVAQADGQSATNQQIPIIYADITVEEEHHDELVITEHPVEQGAAISDHAYKRPSEVIIRAGWSSSSGRARSASYAADVRAQLLALQRSRLPFDLYTGKQSYSQMLIASLTTETTENSEWSLLATIVCRQILLVKTGTTTAPKSENWPQINQTAEQGAQNVTPSTDFNGTPGYSIQDPTTNKSMLPGTFLE